MLENILEVLKGMNFRLRLGVVGSFARGDGPGSPGREDHGGGHDPVCVQRPAVPGRYRGVIHGMDVPLV